MAGLPLMQGAADRPLPALSNECGGGATLSDPHSQPWVLRQGKAQSLVPPLLKAVIAERLSRIPPLHIIAPRLLRGITIEISADGTDRLCRRVHNHFRCWRLTGRVSSWPVLLSMTQSRLSIHERTHVARCSGNRSLARGANH